jgi:hypothetical protein
VPEFHARATDSQHAPGDALCARSRGLQGDTSPKSSYQIVRPRSFRLWGQADIFLAHSITSPVASVRTGCHLTAHRSPARAFGINPLRLSH